MRSAHAISLLAVLFGVFSAPNAYGAKVALLGEVEVRDSSVFLSDFLPAQISASIRTPARKILIGSAPPPGAERVFEGDKIAARLGPDLAAEISIPRQIVVHRTGRSISREEITAAIRSALTRNGFADSDVQPEDIRTLPEVVAVSDSPEIRVRRMEFDDSLKEARFLMAQPGSLPFLVTAQMGDKLLAAVAAREMLPSSTSGSGDSPKESAVAGAVDAEPDSRLRELVAERSRRDAVTDQVTGTLPIGSITLVEPRKMATLCISSSAMQMLLDVTPLEKGSLNQTIRVKVPVTGKVLHARVVGEQRLSATF